MTNPFENDQGVHATRDSKALRVMDHPELSLGPSLTTFTESSNNLSSESEANPRRKRKYAWDEPIVHADIDLQVDDPLPLDWERCLDLQSGRMYYLNRKTLNKSWSRPKDRKLDFDLNISILPSSEGKLGSMSLDDPKQLNITSSNMFAVPCFKCHLLVMLSKSSPSCPNCKFVHPLPMQQNSPLEVKAMKSLETLSLLN